MKKVLSLVLALAMVLGMGTMAFAAPVGVLDDDDAITISVGTIEQGESFSTQDTLAVANVTTAGALGYVTMAGNVSSTGAISGTPTLSVSTAGTTNLATFGFKVSSSATLGNKSVTIDFEDAAAAANTVTVTLTFEVIKSTTPDPDPSTPTDKITIPSGYKVTGIADGWYEYVSWNTKPVNGVEVEPDTTFEGTLDARCFEWEDKDGNTKTPLATWALRTTHIKDVKVRKTNPKNNSGTVANVDFDGIVLEIELVEYFLKCGDTDVTMDLDLTFKGKASGTKYAVDFNIYNDEELIEDGQDYIETDSHMYLKADDSVRNLEMFIGENLYITKSFGKGQKAYARVSLELSAGDEELFHKYPELSDVYTLHTVGVNSANVTARFKDLGDTYFVYDENFKLIGTTSDTKLPFSNKYYLTTAKVDLTGGDEVEEDPADSESEPEDTDNAGTGGGSTAVSNYNPNTGR